MHAHSAVSSPLVERRLLGHAQGLVEVSTDDVELLKDLIDVVRSLVEEFDLETAG